MYSLWGVGAILDAGFEVAVPSLNTCGIGIPHWAVCIFIACRYHLIKRYRKVVIWGKNNLVLHIEVLYIIFLIHYWGSTVAESYTVCGQLSCLFIYSSGVSQAVSCWQLLNQQNALSGLGFIFK